MAYRIRLRRILLLTVLSCSLTLPSHGSNERSDPPADSDAPQPYVDRLIDEDITEEDEAEAFPGATDIWGGLDFFSLGYRYYLNDSDRADALQEHGIVLSARKETINNGSYDLQADGLAADGRPSRSDNGGRVLLRQRGLVINDFWQMDNDLGHHRSVTPDLIANSYRFYLPSTLLQGLNARLYSGRNALYVSAGDIGILGGTAARAFDTTQGSLLGTAVTRDLDNRWTGGLQFWHTADPLGSDTHQSYAGALQYELPDRSLVHQMHFLVDSDGRKGLWLDGEVNRDRWFHNTGLYYFEPELLWTDVAINNDRVGFYWRGDRRGFRWQWTLGTEVFKNNLDDDPALAGFVTTSSFVNATWRFRRRTTFGGVFNLGTRHAESGPAVDDIYNYTLRAFITQQTPVGTSRLQTRASLADGSADSSDSYAVLWDQIWLVPFLNRLNTDVEYLIRQNDPDEISLRLLLEQIIADELWLDGSVQYIYSGAERSGLNYATNASLGVNWQFAPNWKIGLKADTNRNAFRDFEGSADAVEEHRLFLSLDYAVSAPRQPTVYGQSTGSTGRGGIVGRVFLDENRNGRHDPGETALAAIPVTLDGRYSKETGPNGYFEFWPVPGGDHMITIGIEEVPLPWGLEKDRPRRVVVPVRGQATVDFGLVRLDE